MSLLPLYRPAPAGESQETKPPRSGRGDPESFAVFRDFVQHFARA